MTIATVFALFMSFGAYYSGALTHLFFPNPATDLASIADATTHKPNLDLLMPFFITSFVPQWLVLIILSLIHIYSRLPYFNAKRRGVSWPLVMSVR